MAAVNVLNAFTLADLAGPTIVVNSINPGFCHSGLMRETTGIAGFMA
jgi:hypothetical protein